MPDIKPVHVICEPGVDSTFLEATLSGIADVLRVAGAEDRIEVRNFGAWRTSNYRRNGQLVPFQSVDWYVSRGLGYRRDQINGHEILRAFDEEPWQEEDPHYDVLILRNDLYPGPQPGEDRDPSRGVNFILGMTVRNFGTIMSYARFRDVHPSVDIQASCFKTTVVHEFGHLFGLIPDEWSVDATHTFGGKHCLNQCAMRQGLHANDWLVMTRDRLQNGYSPFCNRCTVALRSFFMHGHPGGSVRP